MLKIHIKKIEEKMKELKENKNQYLYLELQLNHNSVFDSLRFFIDIRIKLNEYRKLEKILEDIFKLSNNEYGLSVIRIYLNDIFYLKRLYSYSDLLKFLEELNIKKVKDFNKKEKERLDNLVSVLVSSSDKVLVDYLHNIDKYSEYLKEKFNIDLKIIGYSC